MSIQCYWTAPTGRAAIELRRIFKPEDSGRSERPCSAHPEWNYHWSKARIADVACELRPNPRFENRLTWSFDYQDDPDPEESRWPTHCDCGLEFPQPLGFRNDQFFDRDALYAGVPGAEPSRNIDQPCGAVWRASWYEDCALASGSTATQGIFRLGPDGWIITVKTPGGDWVIDQRSTQGGFWSRDPIPKDVKAGDALPITANPSILMPRYHGWLRNGTLTPA